MDGDKRKFYFNKDENEYAIVTIDSDIAGDMIFRVFSYMDSLIVSLRKIDTDKLDTFIALPLKDLFIINRTGYLILPLKLNTIMDVRGNSSSVFFCKFKFNFLNQKADDINY